MDWLDRPITSGDRFVPLGLCRVVSRGNAWLFLPRGADGGTWTRLPLDQTTALGVATPRQVPWYEYDWIAWEEARGDYRLRIVLGGGRGLLTGLVEKVDGDFD